MKTLLVLATLTSFSALAATQSFKMYTRPNVTPNPGCDVYTRLTLEENHTGVTIHLLNVVGGFCELYVEPNPRSYELEFFRKSCGSDHFESAADEVALVDNRGRICDDVIPGLIVLKENEVTYYSHDRN